MKGRAVILVVVAVAAGLVWWWKGRGNSGGGGEPPRSSSPGNEVVRFANAGLFQQAVEHLRAGTNAARVLADLRVRLGAMTSAEAVQALRDALASGVDAPTGFDLKPDGKGRLVGASSLRVFLLDELLARDPAAAREVARGILARFTTSDEWAASLAVCATDASAAGVDFLREKTRALILHEPWQREPTAGFLEAFDAVVFTRDTAFAPELAGLLNQTNHRALAHAAFLTLDRLALADPAATLTPLAARPELLALRPATRAGYFARADVRDPVQRALVENYLLQSSLAPAELEHFTGTFPNANFMVSQNLLTRSTTPDAVAIAARDAASLAIVEQWLADPRFAHLSPALTRTRARLQQFVPAPR